MRAVVALFLCAGTLVALTGCRTTTTRAPGHGSASRSAARFTLARAGLPTRGNWKCDPACADLDRDGRLDLAGHQRLGDGPALWLNRGDRWQAVVGALALNATPCGGGIALADLNNDQRIDVVIADHCQGVFVFLQTTAGEWEAVVRELFPRRFVPPDADAKRYLGAESVAVGDVNGDGAPDLVVGASDNGGIATYLNDGSGRAWRLINTTLPQTKHAMRVRLVDVNGDGHLDYVAGYAEGPRVWLNDGDGNGRWASSGLPEPMIEGIYNGVAVADVNADGRPDLVAANWYDGPEVYLQQDDETWQKSPDVFPDLLGGAFGVDVGDVDRDGHVDLVFSGRMTRDVGYVYGVFWMRGDSQGNWQVVADCGLPDTGLPFTWGVTLADLNGDGVLDIAAGSGGIVPEQHTPEPAIPAGMLVWHTHTP